MHADVCRSSLVFFLHRGRSATEDILRWTVTWSVGTPTGNEVPLHDALVKTSLKTIYRYITMMKSMFKNVYSESVDETTEKNALHQPESMGIRFFCFDFTPLLFYEKPTVEVRFLFLSIPVPLFLRFTCNVLLIIAFRNTVLVIFHRTKSQSTRPMPLGLQGHWQSFPFLQMRSVLQLLRVPRSSADPISN